MNDEPIIRQREPDKDELSLGYARGYDEDEKRDVYQLKAISQSERATHFYIIGASGTGKTKFLEHLIKQDIKNGEGFGIIDPHGDLIEDVKEQLAALVHHGLDERVVLIDPTDKENSVCFNPLERTDDISAAKLAGELVLVFKKIWADAWGARTDEIFRNTLIILIENNLTLAEFSLILSDHAVRTKLTAHIENDTCREFFEKFESWDKKTKIEYTAPILNKVSAFMSDEQVREFFISPKSSFNLREIMDSGKILLIKLSKGKLKDASDLLGSLLLSKIQMAAFSRENVRESKRKPFYLYIDEFQNFATDSFLDILAEARKYKLSLTLANQNLAQLPPKLRASILTNCGIQACFRISREDAELLAKESYVGIFAKPPAWESYIQELQSLPPRTCLIKSKVFGGVVIVEVPPVYPAWEEVGMDEEDFAAVMESVQFLNISRSYLRKREDIKKEYRTRREALMVTDEPENFREKKS
jgi:type IV secretory pathway TraG/TraD family ATPase VirD4